MKTRIGFGMDVHRLAKGRKFILGGIEIPFDKGPEGHSDADVLVHAICDALLGALSLKDIGHHFPDTSEKYKSISSLVLLEQVVKMISAKGYSIGNIDSTVLLERPKISMYVNKMCAVLSTALGISTDDISIKATTNERMGFVGREEGIAAYAVVLITKAG